MNTLHLSQKHKAFVAVWNYLSGRRGAHYLFHNYRQPVRQVFQQSKVGNSGSVLAPRFTLNGQRNQNLSAFGANANQLSQSLFRFGCMLKGMAAKHQIISVGRKIKGVDVSLDYIPALG